MTFFVVIRRVGDRDSFGTIVYSSTNKMRCLMVKKSHSHPSQHVWIIPEDEIGPTELYESNVWR